MKLLEKLAVSTTALTFATIVGLGIVTSPQLNIGYAKRLEIVVSGTKQIIDTNSDGTPDYIVETNPAPFIVPGIFPGIARGLYTISKPTEEEIREYKRSKPFILNRS